LPALPALAADPAREPRRSGTWRATPNLERARAGARRQPLTLMAQGQRVAWLPANPTGTLYPLGHAQQIWAGVSPPAQRVVALPAVEHTVPARWLPIDPGRRIIPGPASRRAPSDRAHCARLLATSRSGPTVHPRRQASNSAPSERAHCARLVSSMIRRPRSAGRLRAGTVFIHCQKIMMACCTQIHESAHFICPLAFSMASGHGHFFRIGLPLAEKTYFPPLFARCEAYRMRVIRCGPTGGTIRVRVS
jgi:hypothetical protein